MVEFIVGLVVGAVVGVNKDKVVAKVKELVAKAKG